MEDKRTRSDYIREIEQLSKANKILEKSNIKITKRLDELRGWIKDEIWEVDQKLQQGTKFLGETKGNYTLRMYLTYRKNALIDVVKKIKELI